MSDGPSLAYEQPLAPGEARLDVGLESVALSWRPSEREAQGKIVQCSIGMTLCVGGVAARLHFRSHIDIVDWLLSAVYVGIYLVLLVAVVRSARRERAVWANEERLAWSREFWWGEPSIPMTEVSEFVGEPGRKGYVLVARLYPRPDVDLRWYQIRWKSIAPEPRTILTHTDPEFVRRAAFALNALLASSHG